MSEKALPRTVSARRRSVWVRPAQILLAHLFLAVYPVWAQSPTAFPYGGQLVLDQKRVDTGGQPGAYDFTFSAFDGPEAATSRQIGDSVERPGLPLTDGRFQTRLDFGAAALQASQLWIETVVTHRQPTGPKVVARSRQQLQVSSSTASQQPSVSTGATARSANPVTKDAEILARLPAVRVVISDRQNPGQPHFIVDEGSFRQAFGVGSPVTATDISAVGLVAASELRRELIASQQRIRELEAELGRLRFRVHLTLLLVAVLIAGVLLQRQATASDPEAGTSTDKEADGGSQASGEPTPDGSPDTAPAHQEGLETESAELSVSAEALHSEAGQAEELQEAAPLEESAVPDLEKDVSSRTE